jgi:hypothetical protein
MKGLVVIAVALAFAATSRVYANAHITLAADDSVYFGLAGTSTPVPTGDDVFMGTFSGVPAGALNASGQVVNQTELYAIEANFTELAASSQGVGVLGMGAAVSDTPSKPGAFDGQFAGDGSAGGSANGTIYVMVINATTTSAATQVGVFAGEQSIGAASWTYPASMASGTISIDTDQALTVPLVGSYVTGLNGNVWYYNWGDNGSDGDGNGNVTLSALDLASVIPEPSSIMLVVVGMLGMIGLIRRRRS